MHKLNICFILKLRQVSPDARVSTSGIIGASSPPQGHIGHRESKGSARLLIHSDAMISLGSSATQSYDQSESSDSCLLFRTLLNGLKAIGCGSNEPQKLCNFFLAMLYVHSKSAGGLFSAL